MTRQDETIEGPAGSAPGAPVTAAVEACRRSLDAAAHGEREIDPSTLAALAGLPPADLDSTLREFAAAHGTAALGALAVLTSDRADRAVRRAAKRSLYRLAQRGIAPPRRAAARPVVEREPERAARAWSSGIDGTGSRALWIVFEGGFGGAVLCSVIINDTAGILETAGGEVSKKRLERELAALRASQKLPWVETDPARAVALVAEALALHPALGTSPPAAFARWQRFFEGETAGDAVPVPPAPAVEAAPEAVDRSVELLDLPEFAGWFLDPEALQSDAVALLQTRESRLVVSDQIKAEREAAIVSAVLERELTPEARRRWARRLEEMALVLGATGRPEPSAWAVAAAASLRDEARDVRHHPFALALARRGLDVASEVTLGRVKLADVSRKPGASGE
jgi:hypothetical protein